MWIMVILTLAILVAGAGLICWQIRKRALDRWLGRYLVEIPRRRPPGAGDEIHVLLCFADHWEPKGGNASAARARARVARWIHDYPRLFQQFRDSAGRTPRHTFFYPVEEYEAEYLDALADLCRQGFGEVEVHLHHEQDTAQNLRQRLLEFKELLALRHGLLSHHKETGELAYGFIHGNWALDNSRPDGRYCGVTDELSILRDTGCYADFTLPSAPSPAQTSKINSIYYARGVPGRCKAHDTGINVGLGAAPTDGLMLIQGPLLLDWKHRKWGLFPHLENGCLQASQPPTLDRLALWLKARVQIPARPDWFFVKLHLHGAQEEDFRVLLDQPMVRFHQALAEAAAANPRFHYHYATAREMYNLAKAAEAGWTGSVAGALDFVLVRNEMSTATTPQPVLELSAQGEPHAA